MKVSTLVCYSLSAVATVLCAPTTEPRTLNEKRQNLDGQLGMLTGAVDKLPEMKPAKVAQIEPKTGRAGAKRIKLYFGPIKLLGANTKKEAGQLSAMSLDPNSNSWNNRATGIPLDATYLFTRSYLEFEDGKQAATSTGIYNHHLAYVSTKKFVPQFMSCPGQVPNRKTPSTILGGTEERDYTIFSTNDYKFDSGYYISKDDKIVVTGEVVNYNNETKTIFAVSEIEYLEGKIPGFKDVATQIIQVNQCEGGQLGLQVPTGKKVFSVSSQNMTALEDGFVLGGRAHMHDGGSGMQMSIDGKVVCESKAIYGGPAGTRKNEKGEVWETMSGVTECAGPTEVKKGQVVTLRADYDLEKHPGRMHAGSGENGMAEEMAILSFGFATAV